MGFRLNGKHLDGVMHESLMKRLRWVRSVYQGRAWQEYRDVQLPPWQFLETHVVKSRRRPSFSFGGVI
jgi:hypothetical protein